MTLPASGPIDLLQVATELGRPGTAVSFNQADVLALIGKSAGQSVVLPNDFWGKSSTVTVNYTFASSVANASLNVSSISGYSAGKSIINITVNPGVYLYATSTGNYGLTLYGGTSGDVINMVVDGYIIGQGGTGGGAYDDISGNMQILNPTAGGPALYLSYNVSITGSGYIAGGGGGGAGMHGFAGTFGSGGGGAGGGAGGILGLAGCTCSSSPDTFFAGGSGGGLGATGGIGYGDSAGTGSGGGGGRILPGTGGASSNLFGNGGGAGGGGGSSHYIQYSGAGGSAGNAGGNPSFAPGNQISSSGGGGGWGATGGSSGYDAGGGSFYTYPGAAGGKAIALNGYSASHSGVTIYGAVS